MSELSDRLRGIYRIAITDGLGPAGGEEPANPHEFVRRFEVPPIQIEAADALDAAKAKIADLESRALDLASIIREQGCDLKDRRDQLAAAEAREARLREALEKAAVRLVDASNCIGYGGMALKVQEWAHEARAALEAANDPS